MKKQILFLLILFTSANFCFAKSGENKFNIRYLFWDYNEKCHAVYDGNKRIAALPMLNDRKILGIKLDKSNPDLILFAEKKENTYSVNQIDFMKNEKKVLFSFENEIYSFEGFTKTSFFWCDKCENNSEPHILYEYNSTTKTIRRLFEAEDILYNNQAECYERRFITNFLADENKVFFFMDGGFVHDSGTFCVDLKTGESKRITDACRKIYDLNNYEVRSEYAVTDGKNIKLCIFSAMDDDLIIKNINTLKEVQCRFKKRHEGQAGSIVLLSDDYILVPFATKPFTDSINNGLFGSVWTVCFTVFDLSKNKSVYEGFETRTNKLHLLDAILL